MNHLVRVRCRNILISDRYIVANNINTDTIELDLDDEWSGFTPVVVLGTGESAVLQEYSGTPILFPEELLKTTGEVPITIVGYRKEIPTTIVDYREHADELLVTAKSRKSFFVIESGFVPAKGGSLVI